MATQLAAGKWATAVSLIAYAGLVRMQWRYGTLRDGRTPETIAWYLLAFAACLAVLVRAEKRPISMRWAWVAAILFRLLLLFTTPTLSDDVYRYIWDGYVTTQGVSPYAYAINAPELDALDIPQRAQANNAWMASPYLPSAQLLFWGVTAVFPLTPIFMQAMMLIFDLGSAFLLSRLLALAQLPPRRLLLYLWNPLVIVEVAHGAHIDAWMILLTLLSITFTLRQTSFTIHNSLFTIHYSQFLPPLFLSLATLTKILPIFLFPILFWHWNWRQRIGYVALTIGMLAPFGFQAGWGLGGELNGTGLFGALRIYGRQWNFNSGLFHWIEGYLGQRGLEEATDTGKLIVFVIFGLLITVVWLLARTRTSPRAALRLMAAPFIGYTLLTPTLHPWYILILLALLPFLPPAADEPRQRWWLTAPWLYLSGALIFSYLTYLDPLNFGELEWVRRLEWLPTLALLATAVLLTSTHRPSAKS